MEKKIKNYLFYDFVRVTAAPVGLILFRMKKIYTSDEAKRKIKGGALLVSNHSGHIDPMILMFGIWYRRHHFVATKELFDKKGKRFLFERFHCIEIDRDNFGLDSFRLITEQLKEGKLVSIFPEGHINENEELEQFKSGAVLMSISSGKPLIPVYIKKRTSVWQRQCMIIGDPVDPAVMLGKAPSVKDIDKVAQLLREKEIELKEIADKL